MHFAKALLQRIGFFSNAESEAVDPIYANRLERLCASDRKRDARAPAFKSAPSHPEV